MNLTGRFGFLKFALVLVSGRGGLGSFFPQRCVLALQLRAVVLCFLIVNFYY